MGFCVVLLILLGDSEVTLFKYCSVMFTGVLQYLSICYRLRFFVNTLRGEMQRDEDVSVANCLSREPESDLKSELTISIPTAEPKLGQADKMSSSLKKEMSFCEGTCRPKLKMLVDALSTIWPGSLQNERKVFTSGIFVMKQLSRLSDRAINALYILNFHFKSSNF